MPSSTSRAERSQAGSPGRVPTAWLRLQITASFDFAAAAGRFDILAALGVSHVYLSPIAEAVPGSGHGYDVTDHTTVRADLGGATGLDMLLDAAHERSLGVIIDHVPAESASTASVLLRPVPDTGFSDEAVRHRSMLIAPYLHLVADLIGLGGDDRREAVERFEHLER